MAGKVQASRNVTRLKAAHGAIAAMMSDAGLNCDGSPIKESTTPPPEPTEAEAGDVRSCVEAILRKSGSMDGQRAQLRTALQAQMKEDADPWGNGDDVYPYLQDVFPDSLVYEAGGTLYQRPYSFDSTQTPPGVNFGDPQEVEVAYVPKGGGVQESALEVAFVPLVEAAIAADGTMRLKLIDPGWGSSGYYSPDVLKRDGPTVFTEGTKMYLDHPTPSEDAQRPERSVKDLAAVLTKPAQWQDNGPRGPGLYAEAKAYDSHRDALNSVAPDIGVSIRAMGESKMGTAEGKSGPVIQRITGAKSVDFVTEPGRGGRILQLAESKRQQQPNPGGDPTSKETSMQLTESEKKLQGDIATLTETVARQAKALLLSEARSFVRDSLPEGLPAPMRARLVESLTAEPPVKDGALDTAAYKTRIDEAVKAEVSYARSLTGGSPVHGMGESFTEADGGGGQADEDAKLVEKAEASLTESFKRMGLDEKAAALAGKGRV